MINKAEQLDSNKVNVEYLHGSIALCSGSTCMGVYPCVLGVPAWEYSRVQGIAACEYSRVF